MKYFIFVVSDFFFQLEIWRLMQYLNDVDVSLFMNWERLSEIFLENTLAQLVIAKNTNIDLIKKYEEKKLEEHKYFTFRNQSNFLIDSIK